MKSEKVSFLIVLQLLIVCGLTFSESTNSTAKNVNLLWHRKGETTPQPEEDTIKPRFVTPCATPNGDPGICMSIKQCPKLKRQLDNPNADEFLKKSACSPGLYRSGNQLVCCGKFDNFQDRLEDAKDNPLPKTCGYQNMTLKGRIFGGEEAAIGEFPWMAMIIHKNKNGFKTFGCAGALIHFRYVLTAAHCLKSDNIDILGPVFEVVMGEHNTDTEIDCTDNGKKCAEKPQVIRVQDLVVHPNYDKDSTDHWNDIGIIHLKKGIRRSPFVSVICLLQDPDYVPVEYWISGWGKTESRETNPIKLKVSLPKYTFEECSAKYQRLGIKLNDKQMCAGGKKNKDSCSGDSGGPLMVVHGGNRWFAAGVVSYGVSCGRPGWPGVYTKISTHLPWIKEEILKRAIIDKSVKKRTPRNNT